VCCAGGKAVLEVIDKENTQGNCLETGGYFKEGLTRLMAKHDVIGEVRGLGLMLGVELVKDRASKVPGKEECLQVFEKAREMGVLLGKGGFYSNVLRIKPPMCVTRADVDFALEVLDKAFSEL
jgi:alanine-glyoxylate transaminase/(R)-3-amino-2-methylpropionate-pyruvate transaminase